jgi:hypothetical protein
MPVADSAQNRRTPHFAPVSKIQSSRNEVCPSQIGETVRLKDHLHQYASHFGVGHVVAGKFVDKGNLLPDCQSVWQIRGYQNAKCI